MAYPLSRQSKTFGSAHFWAEEYWATIKLQSLSKKNPSLDFSGLINTPFQNRLLTLLKNPPHTKMVDTRNYHDLKGVSPPLWENQRHFINLSSSHAPSCVIAEKYSQEYGEDFGIITFDAHLDLANTPYIHANWLTEVLVGNTAVVGGWAETSVDLQSARGHLAFLAPNVSNLVKNPAFCNWIKGKKLYVTIDLDYFQNGRFHFLGYANFWHRDKIIGHAMNLEQLLAISKGQNLDSQDGQQIWVGEVFNHSTLEDFIIRKKKSIRDQSLEMIQALNRLTTALQTTNPTPSFLAVDLVEYSPICDWNYLTLNELLSNYQRISALFQPFR